MTIQRRQAPLQRFYQSAPMPCPYLPGRIERKLFTILAPTTGAEVNSILTTAGFRRSHDVVYRPICPSCSACLPVRIPAARFTPDKGMRRIIRRNTDIRAEIVEAAATPEQYRLFSRYLNARHDDGDMARMAFADYTGMIEDGNAETQIAEFRDGDGRLIGAMLIDVLGDGLSAVYSFFDPAESKRSFGSFMILALVDRVRALDLDHLYLGYWIEESRKMAYKARFRPLEVLTRDGWEDFDTGLAAADSADGEPLAGFPGQPGFPGHETG